MRRVALGVLTGVALMGATVAHGAPVESRDADATVEPDHAVAVLVDRAHLVVAESIRDREVLEPFAVEPGDVLLFDYRTMHRSRGNGAAHRRAAVSWRWLGDDAIWSPKPGSDPIITQDDTRLAPGDRITDDDTFPLVFSTR